MRLLIAEKPSVARDLARVLGASRKAEGYLEGDGLWISWCVGHLAELEEPAHYDAAWKRWSLDTLPMLPESFALKARKEGRDQFRVLQRLLKAREVDEVINCCDAGREGELIFRYVYELAGCRKPFRRLWVSSMTDEAIRDAWARLRPGADFDALADAARSRSEADWLVGLNATRALTCRSREGGGGTLLSLGRVQTPTLAMIVARDLEIEAFVPEPFWRVAVTFASDAPGGPDRWVGHWFRAGADEPAPAEREGDEEEAPTAERLPDAVTAQAVVAAVAGRTGRIATANRRRQVDKPPLLYDLTALQRRANQRYGLSAQRTLEVAQALYEKHKLLTYPRTDARYLTPDQVPGLPDIVRGLAPIPAYAPICGKLLAAPIKPGKRVVDAAEVGDHHAILPTGKTPSSSLQPDEKRIFDLVARRLLAVLSPDALFDVTELVATVDPGAPLPASLSAPLRFRARGRVCREAGWRAVDPPGPSRDVDLPAVEVGDPAPVLKAEPKEGVTRPPRPFTDATVLRAMETAGRTLDDAELARAMRSRGLGTPATRAAILQTLIDRKYVRRDGRSLVATDNGRALIGAVTVDVLKSPELTAHWEGRLTDLAEGKGQRAAFMRDVRAQTTAIVDAIRGAAAPDVAADPPRAPSRPIGTCPACATPVRRRGSVWSCETGRDCPFVVFETMSGKKLTEKLVRQLLREGSTDPVEGFRSKAGKPFTAALRWDPEARKVAFRFAEPAVGPQPAASRPQPAVRAPPRVGDPCPSCGRGKVMRGRTSLGCDRWREGCAWRSQADS